MFGPVQYAEGCKSVVIPVYVLCVVTEYRKLWFLCWEISNVTDCTVLVVCAVGIE